jgi:hypothetical protein
VDRTSVKLPVTNSICSVTLALGPKMYRSVTVKNAVGTVRSDTGMTPSNLSRFESRRTAA